MRQNHCDQNLDRRHLLSKGALARVTNSDGLTAEVNLMKTITMITSIIVIMINTNSLIMIMMMITR